LSVKELRRAVDAAAGPARRIVLCFALLRALARINFAFALAILAGGLLTDGEFATGAAIVAAVAAAAAAGAGWFQERATLRGEADVAALVERRMVAFMGAAPASTLAQTPRGALIGGLQRWPQAIAGLTVSRRAATMLLVIGPLAAAGAMATISIAAGVMAALATPLLIIGFILLGLTIKRRARAQEAANARLAGLFADRSRAAPTILANHAIGDERDALGRDLAAYADSVMALLRLVFLNDALIDLAVGLAIAFAAVLVGLSQLGQIVVFDFGALALWEALAIVLLAPEVFSPLRRYAEQHHLKAEGDAALDAAAAFLADPEPVASTAHRGPLRTKGLVLEHAGAIPDMQFDGPGLAAIIGPSGAGKTLLLRALAGVDAPADGVAQRPDGDVVWVGADVHLYASRLSEAIMDGRARDERRVADVVAALSLTPEYGWFHEEGDDLARPLDPSGLSGGQRLRLATARALYARPKVVFADEPTAKLDAGAATQVRAALASLAQDGLVVAATHDPALIDQADIVIDVGRLTAAA